MKLEGFGLRRTLLIWVVLVACVSLGSVSVASAEGQTANTGRTEISDWVVDFGGYVRTAYTHVAQPDESGLNFIGENNGFSMADARLGVTATFKRQLFMTVQIDGTSDFRDSVNDTSGEQRVGMRDAFVGYHLMPYITLRAGQEKVPFDVESISSTGEMLFTRRSVVSDGVRGGEGRQVYGAGGLGRPREVGVSLSSERVSFGDTPHGMGYHFAVTNGNDAQNTRNDNNSLAYYGRLTLQTDQSVIGGSKDDALLTLGASYGMNENTPAGFPRPDLLRREDTMMGVDLSFSGYGVDFMAQGLMRNRKFPDSGQADQDTMGIVTQVAYQIPVEGVGFSFAYRFATLDPFTGDAAGAIVENDKLTYHTVGLGYQLPKEMPGEIKVNYTITQEEGVNEINNDQIEAVLQVLW